MKCHHCDNMLIGNEESVGVCPDCLAARDEAADAEELARYRAIFPVPPWSTDPITPEVCERLGMVVKRGVIVQAWRTTEDPQHTVVAFMKGEEPSVRGLIQDGRKHNAGQLACLVAARRESGR